MIDQVSPTPSEKASIAPGQLLTIAQVQKRLGVSRTSVYKRAQLGLLPKPAKLGRSSRWSEQQVSTLADAAARGASEDQIAELVKSFQETRS